MACRQHRAVYAGPRVTEKPWQDDMENRLVFWVPSIAISGMTVYTGDRFPNWKGNVFVGAMRQGEIPGRRSSNASSSTTRQKKSGANRC